MNSQRVTAMPHRTLITIYRTFLLTMAAGLLILAAVLSNVTPALLPTAEHLYGSFGVLGLCSLSVFIAAIGLTFSFASTPGRRLSLLTACASLCLLIASAFLAETWAPGYLRDFLALAAALMMNLRAVAVWILPPRGERFGAREAFFSIKLSALCGCVWFYIDPAQAVPAAMACLILSWPYLADGINAFADRFFEEAAEAAGIRNLSDEAFSTVATARDIVIDKTAVMSGPDLIVTNVMAFNNEPKTLLAVAASAESGSTHPVAQALRHLAGQWGVDLKTPDRFDQTSGLGVVALLGGQSVIIGASDLMKKHKIDSFTADAIARSLEADGKTVLRVAVGGRVVGVLGLEGTLRQDAGVAGMALRTEGLVTWLYSGDSEKTRQALARTLGLEPVENPQPGETVIGAAHRTLQDHRPLILTLSQDRAFLELKTVSAQKDNTEPQAKLLAVSNTEDIGAFPALKELAMRRISLAAHARRFLSGLTLLCGICGGLLLLPLSAAPVLFAINLAILWAFARLAIAEAPQPTTPKAVIQMN